jgi:hypothetical protein
MKMKVWLEKYFGFTQKEIRGLCVLIPFIGLLMAFPTIISWVQSDEKDSITAIHEKEIYDFLTRVQTGRKEKMNSPSFSKKESFIDYFEFNPNELSIQEGIRRGLTERQVQMIQTYVAKGGFFYKKEDFKKIYAISVEDYDRLVPYISIPIVKSNNHPSTGTFLKDSIKTQFVQTKQREVE